MMNISLEKYFGISSSFCSSKNKIENVECLFNKIFSPIIKQADPNLIAQLVANINNNNDNANLIVNLVTNKLKSSQEWEVLISLQVIEALVKGCGETIHDLIARYRFLNEIIKLISPKFYGRQSGDKIKTKCIELLYCWSKGLESKPKIKVAYEMLKIQGLVKEDPIVDQLVINVVPRSHTPVFEDEEKLANLLKSKNPKDLELANKMIKEMVRKDEIKIDKTISRSSEIEQINNNIKLLNEMLTKYDQKTSNLSEKETIRFLYEELEKMKPKIIQIASEIEDNDETISEVIKSNDQCDSVLNKFKQIFQIETDGSDITHADDELIDISSDDSTTILKNSSNSPKIDLFKSSIKDLEDLLIHNNSSLNTMTTNVNLLDDKPLQPEILNKPIENIPIKATKTSTTSSKSYNLTAFDDLNVLGKVLMENSLKPATNSNSQNSIKLNEMIIKSQEDKQIN